VIGFIDDIRSQVVNEWISGRAAAGTPQPRLEGIGCSLVLPYSGLWEKWIGSAMVPGMEVGESRRHSGAVRRPGWD